MPRWSSSREPRIWARRLIACRFTSSRAPRATPSDTAASVGARTTNSGRRHSGPSGQGRSANEQVCRRWTSTSVTDVSLLAVARRPATSQVGWIVTSDLGTNTRRGAGSPGKRAARPSQAACSQLLVNGQRPVRRTVPSPATVTSAQRGEHRRVRLVGVGEHLGGAVGREVPGEVVGAEPDGRRPRRAAVGGGELLDDLDRASGRHGEAAQLDRQQEPVDARGRQRGDHLGVEVAGVVRRRRPGGDQGEDVGGELDVGGEGGGHGCAFLRALHVGEEHVDGGLEVVDEATPARVVRPLLLGDAHLDRRPQVDVGLVGHAGVGEGGDQVAVRLPRQLHRRLRRDEAGDRPLEQELVAHLVGEAELGEAPRAPLEHVDRLPAAVERGHPGVQLTVALGEQGVVDGVLGREVLVQRRGVEPDPGPELPHRDRGESVLAGEVPRRGEHLVDRRLPATLPRSEFKHCWNTPTLFELCQVATSLPWR